MPASGPYGPEVAASFAVYIIVEIRKVKRLLLETTTTKMVYAKEMGGDKSSLLLSIMGMGKTCYQPNTYTHVEISTVWV